MARNEDIERMTAEWRRKHDKMERGTTYLERGRDQSRPRAEIRAAKSPVPQTLAASLGAEVDPMEEAKKAYRAVANGEADMPLVSPDAARAIGATLAAYQGVETVAGATGVGNPNRVAPPEVRAPGHSLGGRGATAGYVAEKTGRPVAEVLRANAAKGKDLSAAAERRAALAEKQRQAATGRLPERIATKLAVEELESIAYQKPLAAISDIIDRYSRQGYHVLRNQVGNYLFRTPEGAAFTDGRVRQLAYLFSRPGTRISRYTAGESFLIASGLARNSLAARQALSAEPHEVKLTTRDVLREVNDQAGERIRNWLIDGVIASTLRRAGKPLGRSTAMQILSSESASAGLQQQVLRQTDMETLVAGLSTGTLARGPKAVLGAIRDRVQNGDTEAIQYLKNTPGVPVAALATLAGAPGATADMLSDLHGSRGVPVSLIEKNLPFAGKGQRSKLTDEHAKFLRGHLDELEQPGLRRWLAQRSPDLAKDVAVPKEVTHPLASMPMDDIEDYLPDPTRAPDAVSRLLNFSTKQPSETQPVDIKFVAQALGRPELSAQDKVDLVRYTLDELHRRMAGYPREAREQQYGGQHPVKAAINLLDVLNRREAWAEHTPKNGRLSDAADANRSLIEGLRSAGLDLRSLNEGLLTDLSPRYAEAAKQRAPWFVERRRSLDNALLDLTSYDYPLDNASFAVTPWTELPRGLHSGFDGWSQFPDFRVTYIARPGAVRIGPRTQGYWTDASTGMSGQHFVEALLSRRMAYQEMQRLRTLRDPELLSSSFDMASSGSPLTWAGSSSSPVFPFSLAARYLAHRNARWAPSGHRRFHFGEINLASQVPRESLKDQLAAIELVHRSGVHSPRESTPQQIEAQNQAVQELQDLARDLGIDFVEARSDTNYSERDQHLPSESDVRRDPRFHHEDAKGGNTRSDAEGGDTPGTPGTPVPEGSAPAQPSGPRIVVNPQVFSDKRDALCVTFNEAFRLVMEENGFEPVSEPTEKQRKFFADTAYANDELQLRRTILARIATLDTSVSDPTDEQLEETAEMLEMVMEVGAPQNEWEQQAVQRLHDVVVKAREGHVQGEEEPLPPLR